MAALANDQHELFCQHYLSSFNAAAAAREAGYAEGSAKVTGHRLLQRDDIQARLRELADEVVGMLEASRERIVAEASALAFSDIRNLVEWDEHGIVRMKASAQLPEAAAVTIRKLKLKDGRLDQLELYGKEKSLELLAKILKLYKEEGPVTVNNYVVEVPQPMSPEEWAERFGKGRKGST